MIESTLWSHLKPELKRVGKFQKVSDRFTPGVPDVLGCCRGLGMAMELKEFSGVKILRVEFRPGQLDWLEDWSEAGGLSWIISSVKQTVMVFPWELGPQLEDGVSPDQALNWSLLTFTKTSRTQWRDFVENLIRLRPCLEN